MERRSQRMLKNSKITLISGKSVRTYARSPRIGRSSVELGERGLELLYQVRAPA